MVATPQPALQAAPQPSEPLPTLREEIGLYSGPRAKNGSPTWSLHDPAANRFFRIGWREFEMLSRWSEGDPGKIATRINRETTLASTEEQVLAMAHFLRANQLIQPLTPQDRERQLQRALAKKPMYIHLLHGYLFFRIPLLYPDRFLKQTLPLVRWCFQPKFWMAMVLVALSGLYLVARQWDSFINTFDYFFSFSGALIFALALSLVKIAHELGHAYTARYYGCRVPTMGVAFLVLWPMLYTETSEAWKLPSQRQRLAVVVAGVAAELALAAIATLAWTFLPDGPFRSAAFFVATISWIMTLTFNMNPFMRFDGYFLLSDALEIQNMHERCFAMGRWFMREFLLGLGNRPPEFVSPGLHRFMIIFAYATWAYRFFLFIGIALLVYHFFFKVLGIFLMVVEVGWFIFLPIFKELIAWYGLRKQVQLGAVTLRTLLLLVLGILLLTLPWRSEISAPGLLQKGGHATLFSPAPAQVESMPVEVGDRVAEGDILMVLNSPDLHHILTQTERDITLFQWQSAFRGMDQALFERNPIIEQQMQSSLSQYAGYREQIEQLTLIAPFSGVVVELAEDLEVGHWVNGKDPLIKMAKEPGWIIEAYVGEDDLGRVQSGVEGYFYPEGLDWPRMKGQIIRMDLGSATVLSEPALASVYGGGIPVRMDAEGGLIPEQGYFPIQLSIPHPPANLTQSLRGTVALSGESENLASRFWRTIVVFLIRESGF